jgi:hypothetical protein
MHVHPFLANGSVILAGANIGAAGLVEGTLCTNRLLASAGTRKRAKDRSCRLLNRTVVLLSRILIGARGDLQQQATNAELGAHPVASTILRDNPSACPIAVKPRELLDPTSVGLNGARSESPHFAGSFVLLKMLHGLESGAQELLRQFARAEFVRTTGKIGEIGD